MLQLPLMLEQQLNARATVRLGAVQAAWRGREKRLPGPCRVCCNPLPVLRPPAVSLPGMPNILPGKRVDGPWPRVLDLLGSA